jgi:hypothetical protein
LLDLNGDQMPDAVSWQTGSSDILVAAGQSLPEARFSNRPIRIALDRDIEDMAGAAGRAPVLAILHPRSIQVVLPVRRDITDPLSRGDVLRPVGNRVRAPGSLGRIAAFPHGRDAIIAAAGNTAAGVRLTVYTFTSGNLVENGTLLIADSVGEQVAGIAIDRFDDADRPQVVLASNSGAGTAAAAGRIRLFALADDHSPVPVTGSGPAHLVVQPNMTPPEGTDCGEQDSFGVEVSITGLRVADIATPAGRTGPDGTPEIIVGGMLSPEKCDRRVAFAQVTVVGEDLALGGLGEAVVWDIPNGALDDPPDIVDIEVGHFNGDDLPDLVLLDSANDALILLRQQPRPCVTFITAITHGHQGIKSVLAEASNLTPVPSGLETVPPVTYNDRFNADLTRRVAGINAARRTPDAGADSPELCPVAHIAINSHWEQATSRGAFLQVLGRVGWLMGALAPSPTCHEPFVTPYPKHDPGSFWLSGFWLLVQQPPIHPRLVCIGPAPNYGTRAQFYLAGVGMAAEFVGRSWSGAASRSAASDLAAVMDSAVVAARGAMDPCGGQVFLDSVGFSRGAPVTSAAMRQVDMRPLRFNADASILYLDAIDPSWGPPPDPHPIATWVNGDRIRPWARSGYVANDPLVLSAGSARISSVFAGFPDVILGSVWPPLAILEAPFNPLPPALSGLNVHRDVIGLPSGYDRSGGLTANGGWFAMAPGLTHVMVRDAMLLNGTPPVMPPPGYVGLGGPAPSFANATHLGAFLLAPRTPAPDLTGWQRDIAPVDDDTPLLPAECRPAGAPVSVPSPVVVATRDSPEEFVSDPEFDLAHGLVANATDLIALTGSLPPEAKEHALDALIPDAQGPYIKAYLTAVAENRLPPGDGFAGWSAPHTCTKCPRLVSSGNESRFADFAERAGGPYPVHDIAALEAAWTASTAPGGTPDGDRVHYLGLVAAGASRVDDAFLDFGIEDMVIEQSLVPDSRRSKRLVVRVGLDFKAPDGKLSAVLTGHGLEASQSLSATSSGDLRALSFVAERTAASGPGSPLDSLRLKGKNVRVSWVSVRPVAPLDHPATGRSYEILLMPHGHDWEAARAMAERRTFEGRAGQLATFADADPTVIAEVLKSLNARHPVWIGASGATGDPASLTWLVDGKPFGRVIADHDVETSLENKTEKAAFVLAMPDGRLKSSGRRATILGQPIGILVAYP